MTACRAAALMVIGLACVGSAPGGGVETAPAPPEAGGLLAGKLGEGAGWDRLWSAATLYKNPANPVVQQLALVGQLQTQYAYGSADQGKYGSADFPEELTWGQIEVRRFRLGMKGTLFNKLSFLNLTDLYPDLSPRIYKRTPETYFTWSEADAFNISLGKTELKFDREQEYSSKDFPLFERTALGNQFYGGELAGAWICGKGIAGGWLYHLGVFSNDREDELTGFDGGAMILAKAGYNYTAATSFDLAEWKVQFLHNTEPGFAATPDCLASPSYAHCIAVSNELADGPFGLTTEFLWGDGVNGRDDVCGVSAMPFWFITERLQLIGDFEFAASREDNGVILPTRYEALALGVGDKSGDRYLAAYLGLNYLVRGHQFKLMTGAKYSHLEGATGGGDFSGWTWLAGVRMAF